jgi:glutathione S-transferase
MVDEPLLYDLTDSPFCLKARICLNLKGVPFRRVTLTVGRRRELKQLNPLAKVPVLVQGTDVIVDSSAIARHLEARVAHPSLIPPDPAAAAYCGLVEEWADEALYFLVGAFKWLNPANRALALESTIGELAGRWPPALVGWAIRRNIRKRYALWGYDESTLAPMVQRMQDNLRVLTGLLGDKPFLLGRRLTLADVAVFAQLAWMRRYAEARLLDAEPVVGAWFERVADIPAVGDALAA